MTNYYFANRCDLHCFLWTLYVCSQYGCFIRSELAVCMQMLHEMSTQPLFSLQMSSEQCDFFDESIIDPLENSVSTRQTVSVHSGTTKHVLSKYANMNWFFTAGFNNWARAPGTCTCSEIPLEHQPETGKEPDNPRQTLR